MAFANSNVTDLMATGIESRTGQIADNAMKNNAVLAQLKVKGRTKTISGGHKIYEEISYGDNLNGGAYSGYDPLPVSPSDNASVAEYQIRQYAVPVIVSGLELLQNAGKEKIIDLVEARLDVAESTMANILDSNVYGDGTGYGGKAINGLEQYANDVATDSQNATVGGIPQASWSFWRSWFVAAANLSASTDAYAAMRNAINAAYAGTTRGNDQVDLMVFGGTMWTRFLNSMQVQQRFTNPTTAELGFESVKYMRADAVCGGGIGGSIGALDIFGLNTKYLRWRPHADCNMVPLAPKERSAVNMDAKVQILGWAGNFTCRGIQFQFRVQSTT